MADGTYTVTYAIAGPAIISLRATVRDWTIPYAPTITTTPIRFHCDANGQFTYRTDDTDYAAIHAAVAACPRMSEEYAADP